jgi:uncharacterized protein (DUF362 family)
MDRRNFLQSIAGLGVASSGWPGAGLLARPSGAPAYFGLHPFIEAHPEAVFIRKTSVASKDDSDGMKREASELAKRIFTLRNIPGIDLSQKFAIKPNLTTSEDSGAKYAMVTDPYVIEGLIAGIGQVGIEGENIYVREGNQVIPYAGTRYHRMAQRSGVHYDDSDSRAPTAKECPDGVIFRRTKYMGPFNYPDCHLLNVSKLKAHSMGLTLCVKNLQGTTARPYIHFCEGLQHAIAEDFQPDALRHVEDLYAKHRREIPRWKTEKGGWMEMWAQRTIDSYSLIRPSILLNMIEGVYAQNGDGFASGPGPRGEPEIFMTNVLIFGKDAFKVDIIGHWLGGHEPGNFGLFHLAKERGVSTALNPHNIPVYRWEDSGPKLAPLDQFARTPLTTLYLANPGEPQYHLCNEPFAYPTEPVSACLSGDEMPGLRVLGQARPGKSPSSLLIEYNLPADGHAALEMYNVFGERVGVLAQGWTRRGVHMAGWSTQGTAPGLYRCQLMAHGVTSARTVWL